MLEIVKGLYAGLASDGESGGGGSEKFKYGANVSVFLGDISQDGTLRIPLQHADIVFNGVKNVASQALIWKFLNTNIQSVTFPDLERLHTPSCCEGAFNTSNISSFSAPKLYEISGFRALSKAFVGTSLSSVEFTSLTELTGRFALELAFQNCRNLKSISFPVLSNLGSEKTQFNQMLSGVAGCTVHFPASLESTLSSWEDVQSGFSGIDTVIVYDL